MVKKNEAKPLGPCCGEVWRGYGITFSKCNNPGKYVVKKKVFCRAHDPEKATRVPEGKTAQTFWLTGFPRFGNSGTTWNDDGDEVECPSEPPLVVKVEAVAHGTMWRIVKGMQEATEVIGSMLVKRPDVLFASRNEAIDDALLKKQVEIDELERQLRFAREQYELLRKELA